MRSAHSDMTQLHHAQWRSIVISKAKCLYFVLELRRRSDCFGKFLLIHCNGSGGSPLWRFILIVRSNKNRLSETVLSVRHFHRIVCSDEAIHSSVRRVRVNECVCVFIVVTFTSFILFKFISCSSAIETLQLLHRFSPKRKEKKKMEMKFPFSLRQVDVWFREFLMRKCIHHCIAVDVYDRDRSSTVLVMHGTWNLFQWSTDWYETEWWRRTKTKPNCTQRTWTIFVVFFLRRLHAHTLHEPVEEMIHRIHVGETMMVIGLENVTIYLNIHTAFFVGNSFSWNRIYFGRQKRRKDEKKKKILATKKSSESILVHGPTCATLDTDVLLVLVLYGTYSVHTVHTWQCHSAATCGVFQRNDKIHELRRCDAVVVVSKYSCENFAWHKIEYRLVASSHRIWQSDRLLIGNKLTPLHSWYCTHWKSQSSPLSSSSSYRWRCFRAAQCAARVSCEYYFIFAIWCSRFTMRQRRILSRSINI